ncbi:MAG: hypothetical protein ABIZ34_03965, partial [Candidatus Limnocylindrales bacterium]
DADEAAIDALVGAATDGLDRDEEAPFWHLVEQVSRLRGMSDRELGLLADILDVVARYSGRSGRTR